MAEKYNIDLWHYPSPHDPALRDHMLIPERRDQWQADPLHLLWPAPVHPLPMPKG